MRKLARLIEKYLIRSIVLSLVLLIVVQGFMTKNPVQLFLSWGEKLEAQVIEYPVNTIPVEDDETSQVIAAPYGLITIAIDKYSSLPKAKIIINDKEYTDFSSSPMELKIMAGDVVEIDSSAYNFPVEYKITEISNNLAFPEPDTTYTANGTIVMIGKVIVK